MQYIVNFVTQLDQIDKSHWQTLFASDHPFTQYDYLHTLEQSGCVSKENGWQPFHLVVYLQSTQAFDLHKQAPIAIMPLYLKSHSYGEYMFDWSWAQAFKEHGVEYYPKLVNAVPYTPVSGQRLAIAEHVKHLHADIMHAITQALITKANALGVSNVQCLFHGAQENDWFNACKIKTAEIAFTTDEKETHLANLEETQWQRREDVQFHWFNKSYQTFDDFLAALSARKRKSIKKERMKVEQQGIVFEHIAGKDITAAMWQQFFHFYQTTYLKRSGHLGYLSLACFMQWGRTIPDHITLVVAHKRITNEAASAPKGSSIIAGSLFFHDQNNLYGRYWGCSEACEFLHFETCYYQGIELAINKGLSCFNAGAQGEHKVARGFEPVITYGRYLLCSSLFNEAIKDFLKREIKHHQAYRQSISLKLPYKAPV